MTDSAGDQPPPHDSIAFVTEELVRFRHDRAWEPFHTPKNLGVSIVIEAGELLEHLQWLPDDEIPAYVENHRAEVAEELADVAIYVMQLAEVLGISLSEALAAKLALNAERYPARLARGNSTKHSELER
jgi:NTP pyrophosphatase (non-canonical NTP hydrolase)